MVGFVKPVVEFRVVQETVNPVKPRVVKEYHQNKGENSVRGGEGTADFRETQLSEVYQ